MHRTLRGGLPRRDRCGDEGCASHCGRSQNVSFGPMPNGCEGDRSLARPVRATFTLKLPSVTNVTGRDQLSKLAQVREHFCDHFRRPFLVHGVTTISDLHHAQRRTVALERLHIRARVTHEPILSSEHDQRRRSE